MSPLRKKIIIGLITGYVLLMAVYAFDAHRQKSAVQTDTLAYLESEGYETQTDLDDWFIGNSAGRNDFYTMYVTFEDEPDATYVYTYRVNTEDIFLIDTIHSKAD